MGNCVLLYMPIFGVYHMFIYRRAQESFYGHDLIVSSWRFQEPKDVLDSEMVINDEEIGCRFVYLEEKNWIHRHRAWLVAVREQGKVAGDLFWLNMLWHCR